LGRANSGNGFLVKAVPILASAICACIGAGLFLLHYKSRMFPYLFLLLPSAHYTESVPGASTTVWFGKPAEAPHSKLVFFTFKGRLGLVRASGIIGHGEREAEFIVPDGTNALRVPAGTRTVRMLNTRTLSFIFTGAAVAILLRNWMHYAQRGSHACHKHLSCTKCSYDLTGNVSGVCPECGQPRRGS
jgi:hypothetical protein